MWHLIFLFITIIFVFLVVYPFLVKFDVRFNILKLKGTIAIIFLNKFRFEIKIRIKHGYVYINHKQKERKEKISNKNFFIVFIKQFIKQTYFREQFLIFDAHSDFGYVNDAKTTAVACGYIDVFAKSVLAKIKNNKKSSDIFILVEPQYDQDIFNVRIMQEVRISVLDLLYAGFYTLFYSWRGYEKDGKNKING